VTAQKLGLADLDYFLDEQFALHMVKRECLDRGRREPVDLEKGIEKPGKAFERGAAFRTRNRDVFPFDSDPSLVPAVPENLFGVTGGGEAQAERELEVEEGLHAVERFRQLRERKRFGSGARRRLQE
jgi:hypothetical protein